MLAKNFIKYLLLASVLCLSGNAYAEGYWGLGFGNASYDIKPLFGTFEVEDAVALKGFVGIRNGNFGFEGEGTVSMHDWEGAIGDASHTVVNLVFSLVGYLPVSDNFSLYGKAGANFWGTSVSYSGAVYEGDNSIDPAFGLGMDWAVSESTHLRAQYSAYSGIGDGVDEGDMEVVTLDFAFYY